MDFWCEVNKTAIKDNITKIKSLSGKKIISVVKGNSYGLDIVSMSGLIEKETDIFGVSTVEEANLINSDKDILIMTPVCKIPKEPKLNHIYTIDDVNDLKLFDKSKYYRVHIYLDSGMNRLGIKNNELDSLISDIKHNHINIKVEGIYTHLHNTQNVEESKKQILMLKEVFDKYSSEIENFHCLNSKGLLNKELLNLASFTNLVRTGNLIYGFIGESQGFKKAFSIKAKVIKKFEIEEDGYIGYLSKSKVKKGTVVGVIPIGTIDKIGFKRDTQDNLFIDLMRFVKSKVNKRTYISFDGRAIKELCEPNMNCILVDITQIKNEKNIVVDLNLSPIQASSSLKKVYV